MSVSRDDVRHIATLARLGVADDRLDALVAELNGILHHMDALQKADTTGAAAEADAARTPMPLRDDELGSVALGRAREDIAPVMRDGFFLVPRLATHDGDAEES